MSRLGSKENKRQMRLNILKHRQKLLQYLENINDTELKPKIKLHPRDLKRLNIKTKKQPIEVKVEIKQEPRVEVEIKQEFEIKDEIKIEPKIEAEIKHKENNGELSDNSDDLLSIESNEDWYSNHSIIKMNNCNSSRKSSRLESVNYVGHKTWSNKNKNNYEYDVDNIFIGYKKNENLKNQLNYAKSSSNDGSITESSSSRFRGSTDREEHNAKERACRERIAIMFKELKKYCTYLDNTRRNPSKHSILLAAKKECELLQNEEQKLIAEKNMWAKSNKLIRKKLKVLLSIS